MASLTGLIARGIGGRASWARAIEQWKRGSGAALAELIRGGEPMDQPVADLVAKIIESTSGRGRGRPRQENGFMKAIIQKSYRDRVILEQAFDSAIKRLAKIEGKEIEKPLLGEANSARERAIRFVAKDLGVAERKVRELTASSRRRK